MQQTAQSKSGATAMKAPTTPAPTPARSQEAKKVSEVLPTFRGLREWLVGRNVTISAPPGHAFTQLYCEPKDEHTPGHFTCMVLDLIIDPSTSQPTTVLARYRLKGARRFYYVDTFDVRGLFLSTELEQEDAVEDLDTQEAGSSASEGDEKKAAKQ